MRRLRILHLGANAVSGAGLTGTIPPALAALPELAQLSIKFNHLEGPLPPALCFGARGGGGGSGSGRGSGGGSESESGLEVLHVNGNRLSGRADWVARCGRLASLDLADNSFEGPLPARAWPRLIKFDAANNAFTGARCVRRTYACVQLSAAARLQAQALAAAAIKQPHPRTHARVHPH